VLAVAFAVTGQGHLLFYLILATPVLLLLMAAYNKVARGAGAKPQRAIGPDSPAPTGSILWVALGGVVLILVLMAAAPLIVYGHEDDNVLMLVAGYGLVFGFAALTLSPLFIRVGFFIWLRLLSTFGKRREFYRGTLDLLAGRLSEAEDCLRGHLQRYPDDACARTALAGALAAQMRHEEALAEADLALADDGRPEALYCHGSILSAIGDTDAGADEMEAALAKKPRMVASRQLLALALIALRRLDAAIAILNRERRGWKNSGYYVILADAYRLIGRSDLAHEAYREAKKRASTESACGLRGSLPVAAYALAAQAKLLEADITAADVLAEDPENILALYARSLVERQRGDWDAVASTMTRLLRLAPPQVVAGLTDPDFTPLLAEKRFRDLLAWAFGAQRQTRERVRARTEPQL
jgi:tetratricopeptide (TPR) repeat protein